MKYLIEDSFTFPYPAEWSIIGHDDFWGKNPIKVYSVFDEDILVAYANVDRCFYQAKDLEDPSDSICEIYEILAST